MNKRYLHLCTVNSKGLQQPEKRRRVTEWVNQQKCDILLLQETHFTSDLENRLTYEFDGDILLGNGSSNSRGVAIWIKNNFNYNIIDFQRDNDGRLLLVNIEIDDDIFTIVNVYAPNKAKNRNSFFKSVKQFIDNYSLGQIVIGGGL